MEKLENILISGKDSNKVNKNNNMEERYIVALLKVIVLTY